MVKTCDGDTYGRMMHRGENLHCTCLVSMLSS